MYVCVLVCAWVCFRNPSFRDFQQMFPSVAKGMDEVLKYSGEDFESKFDLNYTVQITSVHSHVFYM